MKNLLLVGLLISTTASSYAFSLNDAADFQCAEAYAQKLAKIDNHRSWRSIGRIGFVAGTAVGGMFLPTLWMGSVGAVTGALVAAPMFGSLAPGLFDLSFDREPGLIAAVELIALSRFPREELKKTAYDKMITEKRALYALRRGIDYSREEVEKRYPIDAYKFESLVDESLKALNKKRKKNDQAPYSYVDLQNKIAQLSGTDLFCPLVKSGKRKPMTISQVIKTIAKN